MPHPVEFTLLKLPYLPLIEVLKILNPLELFTLSQCSNKLTNVVRWAGTKSYTLSTFTQRQYDFAQLNEQHEIRIFSANLDRMMDSEYTFLDLNGSKMILDGSQIGNVLVLQANDRVAALLAVVNHMRTIFKCRAVRFNNL